MTQSSTISENAKGAQSTGSQEVLQAVLGLVRIGRYRKKTILWAMAACLGIGAAYYSTATRYYRSDAKLMVIEQKADDIAGVSEQAGSDNVMTTHKELVRSPVVVARAIERLAPEHRIDFANAPPRSWVNTLSSRLSASTIRRTNFVNVGYESRHPEAAAAVVRAVIDAYLDFVEETHRGTAGQVLEVLTVERDNLERELATKQQELHQSREKIGHLGLPDHENVLDPIIARALRINESLMDAQQQRLEIQASLAAVQTAIAGRVDLRQHVATVQAAVGERMMLATMGLGENDLVVLAKQQERLLDLRAELDRIRPFYGDSHPRITSLTNQITTTQNFLSSYNNGAGDRPGALPDDQLGPLLVSMLQQSLSQSTTRVQQLEQSFQLAREDAARQSGGFVNLKMLERSVERLEKLHDLLFEKIATIDIHQVQAPIRATIVEEPLPSERPSSPRLRFVLLSSLCGGLALGLGAAYLQDLVDDRFGSPDEMASQLGCRVLAVVRELAQLPGQGLERVAMFVTPQSVECEAFRTLRTSIVFDSNVSDRLVISSSEPSDGKTTISSNLAVSYAQSGKRTLVIDSDLRKPGLTALLDLKGHAGLTDVLSAATDIAGVAARCVQRTQLENLDVLPAGPRRPDPAELLLRPNFAELLAWADLHYDQILIDCPPVLAVSDAQIVARLVDGVIVVVSPEKNHRRLVTRACEAFWSSGATLLGVVANRVTDQSGGGYGYGYGYGYGHDEEVTDTITSKAA